MQTIDERIREVLESLYYNAGNVCGRRNYKIYILMKKNLC